MILPGKKPLTIQKNTIYTGFMIKHSTACLQLRVILLPRFKNKDPFDKMLAWQAINENFTLLSKDKEFDSYQKDGLRRIW